MLQKLIREPLVHFLLAGLMIFIYFKSCSGTGSDGGTIVIDKSRLLNFMQFQSKSFNEEVFDKKLEAMPEEEKQLLVDNLIQDEVLYREAVRLGLDQNDYVIKRRVIQKMEFILASFDESAFEVSDDSLSQYFEKYRDRYYQPAKFTFSHIFFKNDEKNNALSRAKSFSDNFRNKYISPSESLQYGDRFLYHRNYAEKDAEFIKSQFGAAFATMLTSLIADKNAWQGPIPSDHGYHLVCLIQKSEDEMPLLTDVINTVKSDYLIYAKNQHKQKQIDLLIKKYNVEVRL